MQSIERFTNRRRRPFHGAVVSLKQPRKYTASLHLFIKVFSFDFTLFDKEWSRIEILSKMWPHPAQYSFPKIISKVRYPPSFSLVFRFNYSEISSYRQAIVSRKSAIIDFHYYKISFISISQNYIIQKARIFIQQAVRTRRLRRREKGSLKQEIMTVKCRANT